MRIRRAILLVSTFILTGQIGMNAQKSMGKDGVFRTEAFQQSYNDDKTTQSKRDTADVLFSFKEYFGGLGHKRTARIGTLAAGSAVFVGGMQIYDKHYWKLPIVYGGIGGGLGTGIYYHFKYQNSLAAGAPDNIAKRNAIIGFVAAGVTYWGSFLDGTICYKPAKYPHPGKATLYSILCPGLGQIYNHEVWKLPLYWGGMATALSFYFTNRTNYLRWRDIYNEATDPAGSKSPFSAETARFYRDTYRRYRDYSLLAAAAVYLIQIIDANVFSYMHDFEVDDNLSINISPTIITPDNCYASSPVQNPTALGLSMGLKF